MPFVFRNVVQYLFEPIEMTSCWEGIAKIRGDDVVPLRKICSHLVIEVLRFALACLEPHFENISPLAINFRSLGFFDAVAITIDDVNIFEKCIIWKFEFLNWLGKDWVTHGRCIAAWRA